MCDLVSTFCNFWWWPKAFSALETAPRCFDSLAERPYFSASCSTLECYFFWDISKISLCWYLERPLSFWRETLKLGLATSSLFKFSPLPSFKSLPFISLMNFLSFLLRPCWADIWTDYLVCLAGRIPGRIMMEVAKRDWYGFWDGSTAKDKGLAKGFSFMFSLVDAVFYPIWLLLDLDLNYKLSYLLVLLNSISFIPRQISLVL